MAGSKDSRDHNTIFNFLGSNHRSPSPSTRFDDVKFKARARKPTFYFTTHPTPRSTHDFSFVIYTLLSNQANVLLIQ